MGTSAPAGPATAVVAAQVSANPAIQDAVLAEKALIAATAEQAAAVKQLNKAHRAVRYHRVRLWAAKRGVPAWTLGLIAGSASAVVLAIVLIFVFGAGPAAIGAAIVFAYVICGGAVLWCFRAL